MEGVARDKCVEVSAGGRRGRPRGAAPEPRAFSKEVCMRERGNVPAGRRSHRETVSLCSEATRDSRVDSLPSSGDRTAGRSPSLWNRRVAGEGNQLTNSPDTPRQPPINSILGSNQKFYTSTPPLSLSFFSR